MTPTLQNTGLLRPSKRFLRELHRRQYSPITSAFCSDWRRRPSKEGHASEAALEFRTALRLDGDAPLGTLFDETLRESDLPRAKRAVTETVIERLTTKSKTTYVSPHAFVEQYLRINDNEKALPWLDLAFAEHSSFLVQITEDPIFLVDSDF